ncbi:MAG: PAS domain-containing protein, partial [Chloroflexia bacterium]|nr:PAS domain-containing protein [Chloroflexia bacterium]
MGCCLCPAAGPFRPGSSRDACRGKREPDIPQSTPIPGSPWTCTERLVTTIRPGFLIDAMESRPGFRADSLDAVYELLGRLADALVATIGRQVEVVIHDLHNLDASVVAIAGDLTGRAVGAPIPDPDFLPDALATVASDQI